MPDAELPDRALAEQARNRRWWLRAANVLAVPAEDADAAGYPYFLAGAGLLLVGTPLWLWRSHYRATLGRIRQVLAGSGERTLVRVLGIEPDTQHWVLRRQDDGSRIAVKLLGGNGLLVAGDELPAAGLIRGSAKDERRALLALSEPGGTLWAQHRGPFDSGPARRDPARRDPAQPKAINR